MKTKEKIFLSTCSFFVASLAVVTILITRQDEAPAKDANEAAVSIRADVNSDTKEASTSAANRETSMQASEELAMRAAELEAQPMPEQGVVSAPSVETYRQEGARDPHSPPASLSAVAYELAEHMAKARKSEAYAIIYFERLEKCANDAAVMTVRVVCYENARSLAETYPAVLSHEFVKMKEPK